MKKISRREFLAASAAVGATGLLAACGGSSSSTAAPASSAAGQAGSKPVKLVYNEVNPGTSLAGQVAHKLAEEAAALSGGTITVEVHDGGSLMGHENDVLEDMTGAAPTIDVTRIAIMSLDNYGVPSTRLTNVPYLFAGRKHYWDFCASDMGQKMLTDPADKGLGIVGKCYFEEGFRHFFFSKEVKKLEDMKGLNIRVSTSSLYTDMVKGLGANPVDIAFSELYTSLGSVCEGAEQPIANYQSNSFYEPAPYMILDGHVMGTGMLIMTEAGWDKLDADQQEAMAQAFANTEKFNKDKSEAAEAESRKICEDAGAVFTPVDDLKPWQEACVKVINDNIKGLEDMYNDILALA